MAIVSSTPLIVRGEFFVEVKVDFDCCIIFYVHTFV